MPLLCPSDVGLRILTKAVLVGTLTEVLNVANVASNLTAGYTTRPEWRQETQVRFNRMKQYRCPGLTIFWSKSQV